jgi:hypothetical protein
MGEGAGGRLAEIPWAAVGSEISIEARPIHITTAGEHIGKLPRMAPGYRMQGASG